MRRPSRTSDDRSAPNPIGKPGRRVRHDAEVAPDPGCDRLRRPGPSHRRMPRAPIRSAAERRGYVLDGPGGVDAPGGRVSCVPPRAPARRLHSASRVRSRVIVLLLSAPRRGIRGPASPSGLLPRPALRRTSDRTSATPRIKHSGTCLRSADRPGRERWHPRGEGVEAICLGELASFLVAALNDPDAGLSQSQKRTRPAPTGPVTLVGTGSYRARRKRRSRWIRELYTATPGCQTGPSTNGRGA